MSQTAFMPLEPLALALSLGHAATAGAEVAAATMRRGARRPPRLCGRAARIGGQTWRPLEPRELHRSLRNSGSRSPNWFAHSTVDRAISCFMGPRRIPPAAPRDRDRLGRLPSLLLHAVTRIVGLVVIGS
ncbi:hypothetical protein EDB86DRAFT_2834908 [Lactarius hatsudake]|nr:hypothetical protein EDB86DRAFT_2834908 [Lactarius hatsudake]